MPLSGPALACVLAGVLLTALGTDSLLSTSAPALAQSAAQEVTLNMLPQGEPDTLDPSRDTTPGSAAIISQLFEPLLRFDRQLIPQPAAAESYDVSADGTVYTFHLRSDGRWSDGAPVTAQQFEYAWKRILDPSVSAQFAALFVDAGIVGADEYNSGNVATPDRVGIRALDDSTLEIRLLQPFAALPELAALWVVSPLRPELVSANPDGWSEDPSTYSGNGPFMLAELVHQDHLTLVPNPAYVAHLGWHQPTLTRVTILMSTDTVADLLAFERDQRDWLLVPDADANRVLNDPNLALLTRQATELSTYWVSINNDHPPLNDVNIRRALARAVDRTALLHDLATGLGVPMTSIIPPGMPGAEPQAGQELAFDASAARALLELAGFPDGQGFPNVGFTFVATAANQKRAELLHAQWQQNLGIDVELRAMDSPSYQQASQDKQYDLALGGWAADYPDPQDWLATLFSCSGRHNRFNYCDPSFDQLVARADSGGMLADRMTEYHQAQAKLVKAVPVAPLFAQGHLVLIKPWVQAVDGGPLLLTPQDEYPGSMFLDQVRILPHQAASS